MHVINIFNEILLIFPPQIYSPTSKISIFFISNKTIWANDPVIYNDPSLTHIYDVIMTSLDLSTISVLFYLCQASQNFRITFKHSCTLLLNQNHLYIHFQNPNINLSISCLSPWCSFINLNLLLHDTRHLL